MHEGKSWSGHERNCCYLNLGDGTFADLSAAAGLDHPDDGRSVAVTDWDSDGRLDLWLKNRTGPQLRFMRNEGAPGTHYIGLRLVGVKCNRDAVGAVATVRSGDRRIVRRVSAGDGYLAQSSKRLHFGLSDQDGPVDVEIRWPDGNVQRATGLAVDATYRVVQGNQPAKLPPRGGVMLPSPSVADTGTPDDAARIVLKVPLPLPPSLRDLLKRTGMNRPVTLLNLWAHWCKPCLGELKHLSGEAEKWKQAGLGITALCLDKQDDHKKAGDVFHQQTASQGDDAPIKLAHATPALIDTLQLIVDHVRDKRADLSLPTSLLIASDQTVQVLYIGPVSASQLAEDVKVFGDNKVRAHLRRQFPGRWYYRTPRNYPQLARELEERGRDRDSAYYRQFIKQPNQPRRR